MSSSFTYNRILREGAKDPVTADRIVNGRERDKAHVEQKIAEERAKRKMAVMNVSP